MHVEFSVIVPSVGRPEVLADCLAAIAKQKLKPAEIIVVVQEWDVDTQAVAKRLGAKLAIVPRPGLAQAIETGLKSTTADVACFTDDDAVPFADWTLRIRDAFARDPTLGIVCGRDNVGGEVPPMDSLRSVVGVVRRGRIIGNHHVGMGSARVVDHPKGVNMAVRTNIAVEVPLASVVYGQGSQTGNEMILAFALKQRGYLCLYDPAIQVDHFPAERLPGDARTSVSRQKLYERSYNRSYAIFRYAPLRTAVPYLFRCLMVGDRINPGFLLAVCGWLAFPAAKRPQFAPTLRSILSAWQAASKARAACR